MLTFNLFKLSLFLILLKESLVPVRALGSLRVFTLLVFPHVVQIFSRAQIHISACILAGQLWLLPICFLSDSNFRDWIHQWLTCPNQTCYFRFLPVPSFPLVWTPHVYRSWVTIQNSVCMCVLNSRSSALALLCPPGLLSVPLLSTCPTGMLLQ